MAYGSSLPSCIISELSLQLSLTNDIQADDQKVNQYRDGPLWPLSKT